MQRTLSLVTFQAVFLVGAFLWMVNTKQIGSETFRPFQYLSTIFISLFMGYTLIARGPAALKNLGNLRRHKLPLFYIAVSYVFLVTYSVFSDGRAIKNAFWMVSLDMLCVLSWVLIASLHRYDFRQALLVYFKFMTATAVFMVAFSLFQMLDFLELSLGPLFLGISKDFANRIHGLLGEPISLGGLCALGILSAFGVHQLEKDEVVKRFTTLMIPFLGLGLFLSSSKNAMLAFGISFLFLFFRILRLKWLLLAGVVAGGLLALSWELLAPILRLNTDMASYTTRMDAWKNGYQVFSNATFLQLVRGFGAGYFENNFGGAFNSLLRMVIDYGVLMPFFWFLGVLKLFRSSLKKADRFHARVYCSLFIFSLIFSLAQDIFFREFINVTNFNFLSIVAIYLCTADEEGPSTEP